MHRRCPPWRRFYGPSLSDAFPDATIWVVPGLLEGKGVPVPFLGQMTAGMRPRCKQLGERRQRGLQGLSRLLPVRSLAGVPACCRLRAVHFACQPNAAAAAHDSAAGPVAPSPAPGVDPLPSELQGQLESQLLTAPFFIEAAVVLPQHGALLLADTGGCTSVAWLLHG